MGGRGLLAPRRLEARLPEYVAHRLRRLPDPAHRISRGIFAGVFVSFTPFFGLHFLTAALIAWLLRGNILASLHGDLLRQSHHLPDHRHRLGGAGRLDARPAASAPAPGAELGSALPRSSSVTNIRAIFSDDTMNWSRLSDFFRYIFVPYLVGGIVPGILTGIVAYYASYPLILS
jgi:uncharacterized protein